MFFKSTGAATGLYHIHRPGKQKVVDIRIGKMVKGKDNQSGFRKSRRRGIRIVELEHRPGS